MKNTIGFIIVKRRVLISFLIYLFAFCCSANIMTVKEFKEEIKNNSFLKEHGVNEEPVTSQETDKVDYAHEYANSKGGGKFNRPLEQYKGDTLLVGGGKNVGYHYKKDYEEGTKIPSKSDSTNWKIYIMSRMEERLKNLPLWYDLYEPNVPVKIDTIEKKAQLAKKIEQEKQTELDNKIQETNKYYTIDIDPLSEPDFIASFTDLGEMSKIPDNSFQNVIFESVPLFLLLNPNTIKTLERITKPGGTITLENSMQPRLLVVAFGNTKWKDQVYKQLANQVKYFGNNTNKFDIILKN